MMETGMTVLGVDPGSRTTGYGLIKVDTNKFIHIASGCIRLKADELAQRLRMIYDNITELMLTYSPDHVAIEQVFVQHNANAALKLGQARGVAIAAAAEKLETVFEYSARQVKQAVVGYGNAEKNQVQQMVKRLLGLRGTLQEDSADALAIAICHAQHAQSQRCLKEKL